MAGQPFQFDRWPTGTKVLVIISAALLPLGLALAWAASDSVQDANAANRAAAEEQGRAVARAIESLIARNALALSIAANGAFRDRAGDPCIATAQSLALSPAIARRFTIRNPSGDVLCTSGGFPVRRNDLLAAPGDIRLWVSPIDRAIDYRVGVVGGMATGDLGAAALRAAAEEIGQGLAELTISDGGEQLRIIALPPGVRAAELLHRTYAIGRGQLQVHTAVTVKHTILFDQAAMLLP